MTHSSSSAMQRYSIERRTRKYVQGHKFLSIARKYKKKLLHTGLDALKTATEQVVHKTDEFLENKIADAVTKSNDDKIVKPDENRRNVEEIIIPQKNEMRCLKNWEKYYKNETL